MCTQKQPLGTGRAQLGKGDGIRLNRTIYASPEVASGTVLLRVTPRTGNFLAVAAGRKQLLCSLAARAPPPCHSYLLGRAARGAANTSVGKFDLLHS